MVSKTAGFKEFFFSFVSGVGEKLKRELEKSRAKTDSSRYNSHQPVFFLGRLILRSDQFCI